MNNANDPRQTEAGTSSEKSQKCLDPSQSESMAAVLGSHQSDETGQVRRDRGTVAGFFAGKRSLDEAILHQLLGAAKKGLKNAEACIDWYEEEKREYEKQVAELEQLVAMAQEETNAVQTTEEEE